MIEWVQKRDGRIVPFQARKIADAIFAAAEAVGGEDRARAELLAGRVIHLLMQSTFADEAPQVEDIQDLVEKVLIEEGHARTAKAFILYRNQRTRIRETKSELMDVVKEIFQEVGLEFKDAQAPAAKLQRIGLAASESYTLQNLLPRDFSQAHQQGRIYIERLAHYATAFSALVIDLLPLVEGGLPTHGISLPPLCSPLDLERLLRALLAAAAKEAVGELVLANLDKTFASLCRRHSSSPTADEIKRMVEHLIHDGGLWLSSPFQGLSAVSYGLGAGQSAEEQYLRQALQDAAGQGEDFAAYGMQPKLVFPVAEAGTSAANPLLPSTRGEPVATGRTFVNMPRLALEAKSTEEFFAGIDAILSLAARQMVHRHEVLSALKAADVPLVAVAYGDSRGKGQSLAEGALSLMVPVGLGESLAIMSHRYHNFTLTMDELVQLLQNIVAHWRRYFGLNLHIGFAPAPSIGRLFFSQDRRLFPHLQDLGGDTEFYYDQRQADGL